MADIQQNMIANATPATGVATPEGISAGAAAGVKLVQAQQQNEQLKISTQKAQDDLAIGKTNSVISLLDTLFKQNPVVQKRLAPNTKNQISRIAPDFDPSFIDAAVSDPELARKSRIVFQGMRASGVSKAMADESIGAWGDGTVMTDGINHLSEMQQKMAIAKLGAQTKENTAKIIADSRIGAAQIMGGNKLITSQTTANNSYSREIGPSETAVYQANRALGLVKKIDEGELKSTKTLAADLDAATASLLGGGKPSTVYGQQAVHMDDVYSRVQNAKQFLESTPQDTKAPAVLNQLKLDVEALKDFYDEQHQQKYSSWRQGVNDKLTPKLDNRFKQFRRNQGMSEDIPDMNKPQQAQAPAAAPTPAPAGGGNQKVATIQAFKAAMAKDPNTFTLDKALSSQKAKQLGITADDLK